MIDADLTGAYLMGASMTFAIFQNATLNHAVMPFTDLRGTSFTEASLCNATLAGAKCLPGRAFSFASALRTRANLYNPILTYRLKKANEMARVLNPEASYNSVSELRRQASKSLRSTLPVNLSSADLTECDLRGADLQGADLRQAKLHNVFWNDQTHWPQEFKPPPRNPGQPSAPPIPWRDLRNKSHGNTRPGAV